MRSCTQTASPDWLRARPQVASQPVSANVAQSPMNSFVAGSDGASFADALYPHVAFRPVDGNAVADVGKRQNLKLLCYFLTLRGAILEQSDPCHAGLLCPRA